MSYAQAQTYRLTDLGTLGGSNSLAYGINDFGQPVGTSYHAGNASYSATYWNGIANNLGAVGGANGVAYGINNYGEAVGYSMTTGNMAQRATLWSNGTAIDLGTIGGTYSEARSINSSGKIVGYSLTMGDANTHATIWSNGTATDLGTLGGSSSQAYDINDFGQVVGYGQIAVGSNTTQFPGHATLWTNGVASDLGTLGGTISLASAINNAGVVVGYSSTYSGGLAHATLWNNGDIFDLGVNYGQSEAIDINALGQVVGQISIAHGNVSNNGSGYWESRAALWNGLDFVDLNSVFGDASMGFATLSSATSINSAGQIVGYGTTFDGNVHAFMLRPVSVPEPGSVPMVVIGLGMLAFISRRRK